MSRNPESKVASISVDTIGNILTTNLIKENRPVILAARELAKAQTLAGKSGSLAQSLDIPAAIEQADIIVLTIWHTAIQAFFKRYTSQLEDKIIVNPSNPIAPDGQCWSATKK